MVDKLDCCHQLCRARLPHGANGLCVGVGTTYSAVCRRNLAEEEEGERQGQGKEAGAQEERKEGGEEHQN